MLSAVPSFGSVGDSLDDGLAETVNGNSKGRLVWVLDDSGPWKTIEILERATLGGLNKNRLRDYLGDFTPAEFEKTFDAKNRQATVLAEITTLDFP